MAIGIGFEFVKIKALDNQWFFMAPSRWGYSLTPIPPNVAVPSGAVRLDCQARDVFNINADAVDQDGDLFSQKTQWSWGEP